MEAAVLKLITILLSVPSFGVQAVPSSPAPAEVLAYAPKNADAMVFVDFRAFVGNNVQAIKALPQHPAIKRNKETVAIARDAIREVETGINMVKGLINVDVTQDVHWAAGWVVVPSSGDPKFLLAVRGNLPADLLGRVGGMVGASPTRIGSGEALTAPGGGEMVARTQDGTYLVGTASWVKARLAKNWRSRARNANVTAALAEKPFFLATSHPTRTAMKRYSREISDPEAAVFADLMTGHNFASLGLTHDGVSWRWHSRSQRGHERATTASEGMIELMRAGHLSTRGMVKLALSVAASYTAIEPEVKALMAYEKDILAVVDAITGDGSFKVAVDDQKARRKLHVRATGAELSDVVPMAGAVPLIAAGAFFGYSSAAPASATQPARARGVKRAAP